MRKGSIDPDVNVQTMNISKMKPHLNERSVLETESYNVTNHCSGSTNNKVHIAPGVNHMSQLTQLHNKSHLSNNKVNESFIINTCKLSATLQHVLEEFFKSQRVCDSKEKSEILFHNLEKEWITTLEAFISLTPEQCHLLKIPLGLPNAVRHYAQANGYLSTKQLREELLQPLALKDLGKTCSIQNTHFLHENIREFEETPSFKKKRRSSPINDYVSEQPYLKTPFIKQRTLTWLSANHQTNTAIPNPSSNGYLYNKGRPNEETVSNACAAQVPGLSSRQQMQVTSEIKQDNTRNYYRPFNSFISRDKKENTTFDYFSTQACCFTCGQLIKYCTCKKDA